MPLVLSALLAAIHALVAGAATLRQPVTQRGAVEASEKLEPSATAVSKVIELLKGLERQIEEEGKTEAAEYDKFACFCKEQADEHLYMIEKSEEKIKVLDAQINDLGAEISVLNSDISNLGDRITALEGKIKKETKRRAKAAEKFKEMDAELLEAIKTVDYALQALRESRGELDDAKISLLQKMAGQAAALLPPDHGLKANAALISILRQKPAAYQYQSGDVIATLMKLRDQFSKVKKDIFDAEMESKSISDKKVLGWSNEKQFKEEEKAEKEELEAAKSEEKSTKEKEKDSEEDDKGYDEEFQAELTSQCQTRAEEWDQRSKARADELQALAEAIEILDTGVEKNYDANKRLVGFAQRSAMNARPLSLFQLRGHDAGAASSGAKAVRSVVDQLKRAAKRIGSPKLVAIAMKAALQEDHFVKVRGLIQDLIDRLEAEALAEADQKSYCDKEIGTAVTKRDDEKGEIEKQNTIVAQKEVKVSTLKQEIAVLDMEIAELQKALNEATELRAEEKIANERTIADAKAGKKAVDEAISILEAYYNSQGGATAPGSSGGSSSPAPAGSPSPTGGSLVQRRSLVAGGAPAPAPAYQRFRATGADREGNTVDDLAPEMSYEGDYVGKVSSQGGVIGLLQVIKSDFERTIETVGNAEDDAQKKFNTFERNTKGSIASKRGSKSSKEGEIEAAEDDIVTAKDNRADAEKLHDAALEELEKLKAICVEGAESYEERSAKRDKEIEALKEALEILENFNKE